MRIAHHPEDGDERGKGRGSNHNPGYWCAILHDIPIFGHSSALCRLPYIVSMRQPKCGFLSTHDVTKETAPVAAEPEHFVASGEE
jgi:hypothetical protein